MNKVILSGNLTRDPESRFTKDGKQITDFGLAVKGRKETIFLDIKTFEKQAENVGKYKKKGDPVLVEGRIEIDSWEKDGQKRTKTYVVAENVEFLSGGKPEGQTGSAKTSNAKTAPAKDDDGPPF